MTPATSEHLVVAARPRLSIDGVEQPRLGVDLIRLQADEDEQGLARLEVVLLNWGRAAQDAEPGFLYFDGEILELGKTVRVEAGDDNADVLFEGVITSLEGCYPELRPPELVLRAEDDGQRLRMRERSRAFEDATDADLAQRIADDHGLRADVDADGPSHAELLQFGQSDLAFLRERARAVDARLSFADGTLLFRRRRENDGDDPIKLSRLNELLRFDVAADLAHQRREVRVHGWSVEDKTAIHETATEDVVRAEATGAGRTGPAVLEEADIDAIEDLHLEMPATIDEARALAEARLRERARRFVRGHGTTDGTPSMHVGGRVELLHLGPWFSGEYHVVALSHRYDQEEGLRTHFDCERVELGPSR